jgi:SAM-dependent methyltransferase
VAERLSSGAMVLDVGCGSGRDLLYFKNKGFEVIGFERSAGLAKLAREHSDVEVIEGDFETYDFSFISADAIISSGSLVHVEHERLADVLKNIVQALEKTGIFYVSLKKGEGTKIDALGRSFYYWKDEELRKVYENLNYKVLDFYQNKSIANSDDVWLSYIFRK